MFEHVRADCIIVGGGAAGLRAAMECLENGLRTVLLTKSTLGQSHSLMAEGGVNAAIGQRDPTDNWKVHFDDTMRAGRFINNKQMVEILCRESPQRTYDLFSYSAGFDIDDDGKLVQVSGPSGGQSKDRVIAVGDFIGFVLQRALTYKALKLGLKVIDEAICVKIILDDDGETAGIIAFSLKHSTFLFVESSSIILACGGAGRLFSRTSNPIETTGEGYILALESGIELRDMEMIQFHPTALCAPPCAIGILVTEAARGIGGRLYNTNGERFMEHYDPKKLELAPRDVVARAIIQEVEEGRGTKNGGVLLDLTHLDPQIISNRLQNTARILKSYQGIDISTNPIEVSPAAHHFMGGLVPTNVETMESTPGIFLAGEICWGSHGANRLGGNALAETQVFGARAGRGASLRYQELKGKRVKVSETKLKEEIKDLEELIKPAGNNSTSVYSIRKRLGDVMYKYVGIVRTLDGLQEAYRQVEMLESEFRKCGKKIDNYYSFAHIFECSKMIVLAKIVIQSALYRRESRGAHFRRDFPRESAEIFNTSVLPKTPYNVRKVYVK